MASPASEESQELPGSLHLQNKQGMRVAGSAHPVPEEITVTPGRQERWDLREPRELKEMTVVPDRRGRQALQEIAEQTDSPGPWELKDHQEIEESEE